MKEGTNGEMVVVTKSVTALTTLLKTEGLTSSSLKALKGCLGRPPEGFRLAPGPAGLAAAQQLNRRYSNKLCGLYQNGVAFQFSRRTK